MVEQAEDKPRTVVLNLNPPARKIVEEIRSDSGIPSTEAMTRILEWFASLDRKLRLAVLSRDDQTRRELSGLVFREMSDFEMYADDLVRQRLIAHVAAGKDALAVGEITAAEAIAVIQTMSRRLAVLMPTYQDAMNNKVETTIVDAKIAAERQKRKNK